MQQALLAFALLVVATVVFATMGYAFSQRQDESAASTTVATTPAEELLAAESAGGAGGGGGIDDGGVESPAGPAGADDPGPDSTTTSVPASGGESSPSSSSDEASPTSKGETFVTPTAGATAGKAAPNATTTTKADTATKVTTTTKAEKESNTTTTAEEGRRRRRSGGSNTTNTTAATTTTKAPTTTKATTTTTKATTTTNAAPPTTVWSGSGLWRPRPGTSWQWQLTGSVDTSVAAEMFDIDYEQSASVVSALHAKGRAVVCYLSAGSWEDWRPDAGVFPSSVLGSSNGWPGEKWLDIRRIDVLGPIMEARFDVCAQKGFDGVEVDNIDGYTNNTGFNLSASDQIAYNRFLADAAHARGLSIGLKNDVDQAAALQPYFDFAINEECFQYNECSALSVFIANNKAVFHVEYDSSTSSFCPTTTGLGFSSMKKNLNLNAWRQYCP